MKLALTDEMVKRLADFLQTEWAGPYMARIRDFMPEERSYPPDSPEYQAWVAAGREAEEQAREMAHLALRYALGDSAA